MRKTNMMPLVSEITKYLKVKAGKDNLWMPKDFSIQNEDLEIKPRNFTFNVKYSFSNLKRDNSFTAGVYGGRARADRLYVILCDTFNGGEPFVDAYFKYIFPNHFNDKIRRLTNEARREYVTELQLMAATVPVTKQGAFDKRTRGYKALAVKKALYSQGVQEKASRLGDDIRKHIIQCLRSGRIQLRYVTGGEALKKRKKLGLDSLHTFYASGRLIEELSVIYTVVDEGKNIGK